MHRALATMIRTIYPPRCMACETHTDEAQALCPACWSKTGFISGSTCITCCAPLIGEANGEPCDTCLRYPPPWSLGKAALEYDGVGRDLVLALKKADRLDLVPAMSRWMQQAAREILPVTDIVAPVPLHPGRYFKRRFNQSAELARHLAANSNLLYSGELLSRIKRTESQHGKDRIQRFENLQAAIAPTPRNRAIIADRRILLVDDVLTTGATLSACTEACYAAGAKNVDILVLARVVNRQ